MGTMRFYKSYSFKDKDPVIDIMRTAVSDVGLSYEEIEELSDVRASTLKAWFHGNTKRPQHATIMAVARAIGYDWRLIRVSRVARPKV